MSARSMEAKVRPAEHSSEIGSQDGAGEEGSL
jgi:hypothetical protein